MLSAVATMMVAVGVLAAWKDLPGLLIGRLVTGVWPRCRHRACSHSEWVPCWRVWCCLLFPCAFGFAILVGLGVAVSGWALLGRRP
jgi:hypothetical protein